MCQGIADCYVAPGRFEFSVRVARLVSFNQNDQCAPVLFVRERTRCLGVGSRQVICKLSKGDLIVRVDLAAHVECRFRACADKRKIADRALYHLFVPAGHPGCAPAAILAEAVGLVGMCQSAALYAQPVGAIVTRVAVTFTMSAKFAVVAMFLAVAVVGQPDGAPDQAAAWAALETQKSLMDGIYHTRMYAILVGKNCAAHSELFGVLDRIEKVAIDIRKRILLVVGNQLPSHVNRQILDLHKNLHGLREKVAMVLKSLEKEVSRTAGRGCDDPFPAFYRLIHDAPYPTDYAHRHDAP